MKWTIGNKPVITEVDRTSFFNTKYGMDVMSKRKPTAAEMKTLISPGLAPRPFSLTRLLSLSMLSCWHSAAGRPNREDSPNSPVSVRMNLKYLCKAPLPPPILYFDRQAIDLLHNQGVTTVIHPTRKLLTTGSLKPDEEIVKVVDEYNMVMIRPHLIGADGQEKAWRVFRHL